MIEALPQHFRSAQPGAVGVGGLRWYAHGRLSRDLELFGSLVSNQSCLEPNLGRGDEMPNWIWWVGLIVAYVVLTQWLLPKLGVST
jgi:hypothetical protein